jgi:lipopolysaccharide/colanic/teichoic acid biosynthesis glycosyltransferase
MITGRRPPGAPQIPFDAHISRGLDIFVALMGLLVLAPLLITVAVLIYITDPGPILFRQVRIGRRGQKFYCYKFRSMRVDAEAQLKKILAENEDMRAEWAQNHKLRNDPRITWIGGFLRKSSIDELPQFWNVLKGEMSLVGPRPIVAAEVPRYGRNFKYYCSVRPGITGLWQVSGRSDVSFWTRVACDIAYAKNHCTILNIKLICATVPAVLLRRGSY